MGVWPPSLILIPLCGRHAELRIIPYRRVWYYLQQHANYSHFLSHSQLRAGNRHLQSTGFALVTPPHHDLQTSFFFQADSESLGCWKLCPNTQQSHAATKAYVTGVEQKKQKETGKDADTRIRTRR